MTTRQKLTVAIGTVNTLLTIVVVGVFISLYSLLSHENIKQDLLLEAEEIVTQHIIIEPERIAFVADSGTQTSIEQDLLTDRLSAVIFTDKAEFAGSFGVFEVKSVLDKKLDSFKQQAMQICSTQQYQYAADTSDDSPYEILYYPIVSEQKCRGVLLVAASLTSVNKLQRTAFYLGALVVCIVLVSNVIFGNYLAGFLLRPLARISQKMQEMSAEQRVTPLPAYASQDELGQVVSSFNAMVYRVGEGIERQKEFVANASHELKTPIARALSDIEMAQLYLKKQDITQVVSHLSRSQDQLSALHIVIDSLLLATKMKHSELEVTELSVSKIIEQERETLLSEITQKQVSFSCSVAESWKIIADARIWQIMVRNILSNAVKYNIQKGSIAISAKIDATKWCVSIENTTSELHQKSTSSVRFERGDESIAGSGIGVSIVKEVATLAGYTIDINTSENTYMISISGNISQML